MEKLFDVSVIKTLKEGIKKGYWTLEDLDKPSPQWKEVVNTCNGHPSFIRGYQGVNFQNLARLKEPIPPPVEEKVEVINPKDYPTFF